MREIWKIILLLLKFDWIYELIDIYGVQLAAYCSCVSYNKHFIHSRCEICGKSFSQASYLNTHRRIHQTDKRTYKCEYCSKSYRHHTNLAAHRRTHKGLSYECEICYKSFGYECLLRRHLLMHSTERPHKCAICGKGFNRPIVLKQHMQVHSGEKAYVCEWCGKRFSQNSSRKRHLKECACAKSGNDKDLEGDETVREEKT